MQVNKKSNINFSGTFIIKPKTNEIKETIPNLIKKGKQIFYDVKNEGDIAIVTRDTYDGKIKDFIESSNLGFEYYPEISTKSGLDDEIPSTLKNILDIKNNCVIDNMQTLNKYLHKHKIHLSKQIEYLHEAMNTLRLNIEDLKIKFNDKGLFVIRDESKKRTIKSTGFRGGAALIHVIPDSHAQESKKIMLYKNGKEVQKEYNTPNEIFNFLKTFKSFIDSD